MHMLIRVACEAYDAEDATGIAHGLFEGVDAPLYPTFDYGTLMTEDGRDLVWELYALAGSGYLEAADQDGHTLRVQLPDITPEHVTIRFHFDDLAGIGYQNGWLAACRDSGCVVETANCG
jgi:hypothetical protein